MKMKDILQFQGEYRWLSNFAPVKIHYEGRTYNSVECAYMSAKSNDPQWKDVCSHPQAKPGNIKRMSKGIKLVSDWTTKKTEVMKICLGLKFSQEPYRSLLLKTENAHIEEGNTWGDTYWGVDLNSRQGESILGELIIEIRSQLRK